MALLDDKIKNLPLSSGVYIMRSISGEIIYIGKAVVLRNRVRQYFLNTQKPARVQAMADNVADIDYIITLSEKDALSLEANLIKKHKPKYNILLKDDKSKPYIKINLKEDFPYLEVTRNVKRDGAKYFGPYFNGIYVNDVVDIIKSAYQMRACPKRFYSNKRECLNYHIGLCLAPCCARVGKQAYRETVNRVLAFLSGREDTAEELISRQMDDAVAKEEFERAIIYRNQLATLKKLKERTLSELGTHLDIDSFSFVTSELGGAALSVVIVRAGKLMGVKSFIVSGAALDAESDSVTGFIAQYYAGNNPLPQMICVENETATDALEEYLASLGGKGIEITVPKIGTKKRLLDMAKENAVDYLARNEEKSAQEYSRTIGAAEELAQILNIKSARRMECYDISNISGVDKVASGVVFIGGAPSKKDYRRYKIKTVEGADDFASMKETLSRRLKRAAGGDTKFDELPDLIVIDGGKGQLSSAMEAMNEQGYNIDMISLAKREEEIFTPHSSVPIVLEKSSRVIKLLQRIRDEAHRFAITYHRTLRSRRYGSKLENIPGVGKVKRTILLKHFGSAAGIAAAGYDAIAALKGMDKTTARAVVDYFEEERKKKLDKNTQTEEIILNEI